MMRILRQVQRSIKNAGFWAGFFLLLFALQFVHMDASLYWRDPLTYFRSGDFFYTFIISIHVGILRFIFPLCAILPSGMLYVEEKESRFLIPTLHRQSPRSYVANRLLASALAAVLMVLAALAVTTVFYLIVCPVEYQEDSFQVAAMSSAYSWRAEPKHFWIFVLEAAGRLALSAIFWTWIALAFSGVWANKVFVSVTTLVLAYAMEAVQLKLGLNEWTIAFIQAPDVHTQTPLWIPLVKQLGYIMVAGGLCWGSLRCAVSAQIQQHVQMLHDGATSFLSRFLPEQRVHIPHCCMGTAIARLWTDFRAFFTPSALLCAVGVSVLCTILCPVFSFSSFTIGELLLSTFGGISWCDPELDYYAIGKWVLLLLPPMMGVAWGLERELTIRRPLTLYRFGDARTWWRSRAVASLLGPFLIVCIMYGSAIVVGYFAGARGFTVYLTDADGFSVPGKGILTTMVLQFGLQVLMLTQFQILFHAIFGDVKAGIAAYLVPVLAQLVACSNVEQTRNIWMPTNWGMIARTNLFCIAGYEYGEGLWMDLCAVDPSKAIIAQFVISLLLISLNRIIVPYVCSRRQ